MLIDNQLKTNNYLNGNPLVQIYRQKEKFKQ